MNLMKLISDQLLKVGSKSRVITRGEIVELSQDNLPSKGKDRL